MTGTLKLAAILNPGEMKEATAFVGGRKVRMVDVPPDVATQATNDLMAHKRQPTEANIAAWWVRNGMPKQ